MDLALLFAFLYALAGALVATLFAEARLRQLGGAPARSLDPLTIAVLILIGPVLVVVFAIPLVLALLVRDVLHLGDKRRAKRALAKAMSEKQAARERVLRRFQN